MLRVESECEHWVQQPEIVDRVTGCDLKRTLGVLHFFVSYLVITILQGHYIPPIIMLLMGMWISLTKKPMKPIIRKPRPVARAILANSVENIVVTREMISVKTKDILD